MNSKTPEVTKLFDASKPFTVKLIDDRTVTVSFPSDEQLIRRKMSVTILMKDVGRGETETSSEVKEGSELRILNEIREPGDDVDEAEASWVLNKVCYTDVVSVDREGAAYRVVMDVAGASTEHLIGLPKQAQIIEHLRLGTSFRNRPDKTRAFRSGFGNADRLYDSLLIEKVGYAPSSRVPIIHKSVALDAAIAELQRKLEQDALESPF